MFGFFELLNIDGSFLLLNVLIQLSLMASFAILFAKKFKNSAAARYAILYSAMLSLPILLGFSLLFQAGEQSLVYLPIEDSSFQTSTSNSATGLEFAAAAKESSASNGEYWSTEPEGTIHFGQALQAVYTEYLPVNLPSVATLLADSESKAFLLWQWFVGLSFSLQISLLWFAGFCLQSLGLVRSFQKLKQLAARSRDLPAGEQEKVDQCLEGISLNYKQVGIALSREVSSPVVMGYISSTLLLPEGFVSQLGHTELRAVLLHEMAHVERYDALKNLIQKFLLALFWFHPLVHIMDRMISISREEICDNYVLSQQQALEYGEVLLSVSAMQANLAMSPNNNLRTAQVPLAMGMIGSEWKLEQRIIELLSERREKTMKLSKPRNHLVQGTLVSLSILLAACQVGAAENVNSAALTAQDRELAEQQEALEMNALALESAAEIMEADARRMEADVERMHADIQRTEIEIARINDEAAINADIDIRALRMGVEAQRIDIEAREMVRELREHSVELAIDLEDVRAQVEQELEDADIGGSIRESMDELRSNLAELDEETVVEGIDSEQINLITRQALQTALRSLEAIDVEALELSIRKSLEIELDSLEILELDINIDIDPEIDAIDFSADQVRQFEIERLNANSTLTI
jgi:beta-lactamase regulating signal transducer with metallopeptidase domain